MVAGKTKSGIEFTIDERIKDDTRLLQYMVIMQKSEDEDEQASALFGLLALIFGGNDGIMSFQNAIAATHDGICTSKLLIEELTEILASLNVKNS